MSDISDEQVDTCRICSGPAEPSQPLFHPCKCSGTIKYIHQDCLTTWLAHSKKRNCDVCKAEYAFEKIYDPNMPDRLPPLIFAKRLAAQIMHWVIFAFRGVAVGTVWLMVLPYMTILVWRLYFWAGETLAWRTYGEHRPAQAIPPSSSNSSNSTSSVLNGRQTYFLGADVYISQLLPNLWSDIFAGQIIASLIIVLFLTIFLLREWIVQNARPGVFGDPLGDGLALPDDAVAELEPVPAVPDPAANADPLAPEPQAALFRRPANEGIEGMAQSKTLEQLQKLGREAEEDEQFVNATGEEQQRIARLEPDRARDHMRRQRDKYFTRAGRPGTRHPAINAKLSEYKPPLGPRSDWYAETESAPNPISIPLPDSGSSSDDERPAPSGSTIPVKRTKDLHPQKRRRRNLTLLPPTPTDEEYISNNANAWIDSDPPTSAITVPTDWTFSESRTPHGIPPSDAINAPLVAGTNTQESPSESSSGRRLSSASQADSWDLVGSSSSASTSSFAPVEKNTVPSPDIRPIVAGTVFPKSLPSAVVISSQPQLVPPLDKDDGSARATVTKSIRSESESWAPRNPPKPLPNGLPIRLPPNIPISARQNSPGTLPRRPPLPPSTPNDELPPPSPRPSHARPSPLPKAGFVPTASNSTPVGPSPLRDAQGDSALGAIYRAPEDLEPSTSYFPQHKDAGGNESIKYNLNIDSAEDPGNTIWEDEMEGTAPTEDEDEPHADENVAREDVARALAMLEPAVAPRLNERDGEEEDQDAEEGGEPADIPDGVEDDIDGLLEAVGMRGPLLGIIQNVSLMVFILYMTIGAAMWIPYTIGKAFALNIMKPKRLLFVIHLPVKAVRLVTDPIVDGILWFLRPSVAHLFKIFTEVWKLRVSDRAKSGIKFDILYQHASRRLSQITPSILRYSKRRPAKVTSQWSSLQWAIPKGLSMLYPFKPSSTAELKSSRLLWAFKEFRFAVDWAGARWKELAIGNNIIEQVFAVSLGYMVVILAALIFLHTGVMLNGATRFMRSIITQQFIVFKVVCFIVVELFFFPLGCGIILDVSTVPLFPDATAWTRLQYTKDAFATSIFFHWMLGTMFMYQFAMVLSCARSLMRKGALWFVKDPQDPNFHPIRDILDRPTLGQLRKLGISAAMYSIAIGGGVGVAVYGLRYIWTPYQHLLPLRWNSRHPVSEVPIDLLFLHIVVPHIVENPRDAIARLCTIWWEHAAHELRLTSYMFGERVVEEEVPSHFTWRRLPLVRDLTWVRTIERDERPVAVNENDPSENGRFARVPATDSVVFPPGVSQMLVTTNENGIALTEDGQRLIEAQDAAAERAHRTVADDYQLVYLPPHFDVRVGVFIGYLWLTSVTTLTVAIGTPIQVGRRVLDLLPGIPAHDGYSFLVGTTIAWVLFVSGHSIRRVYQSKASGRLDITRERNLNSWARFKMTTRLYLGWLPTIRTAAFIFKALAVGVAVCFAIPLMLAVTLQLYLIIPIRHAISYPSTFTPTIHIWEDWALGCVLATVLVRMGRMQPRTPMLRAWDTLVVGGLLSIDKATFTDLIFPLVGGLLVLIFVPGSIPQLLNRILGGGVNHSFSALAVYPTLFVGALTVQVVEALVSMLEKWAQKVRDKEYLIDLRLQNLQDGAPRFNTNTPVDDRPIGIIG